MQHNTKFTIVPCEKGSQHCKAPICTHVPEQAQHHTAHNALSSSTRTAVPIRRNVSFALKQQSTQSFQLVFQSRVHSQKSRRCVNSKRRIALIRSIRNVQNAQHRPLTHTNWSTNPRTACTTSSPFTGQVRFLRDTLVAQSRCKTHQRAVTHKSRARSTSSETS